MSQEQEQRVPTFYFGNKPGPGKIEFLDQQINFKFISHKSEGRPIFLDPFKTNLLCTKLESIFKLFKELERNGSKKKETELVVCPILTEDKYAVLLKLYTYDYKPFISLRSYWKKCKNEDEWRNSKGGNVLNNVDPGDLKRFVAQCLECVDVSIKTDDGGTLETSKCKSRWDEKPSPKSAPPSDDDDEDEQIIEEDENFGNCRKRKSMQKRGTRSKVAALDSDVN